MHAIVEHKDPSAEQRAIREVHTGIMAAPTALLARWVMAQANDDVQLVTAAAVGCLMTRNWRRRGPMAGC